MSLDEVDRCPLGTMIDLVSCLAVYNGAAKEVKQIKDYDAIMEMR